MKIRFSAVQYDTIQPGKKYTLEIPGPCTKTASRTTFEVTGKSPAALETGPKASAHTLQVTDVIHTAGFNPIHNGQVQIFPDSTGQILYLNEVI